MKISHYDSYREFLKDFFEQKRRQSSKFSLIYFSRLIEASDSYIKLVLSGKRNLNLDKAKILADKIGLSRVDASYFLTLVMKEKAETIDLKDFYESILLNFKDLLDLSYSDTMDFQNVMRDSLTWEIYTLVRHKNFRADPGWIASILNSPHASPERVERAFQHLVDTGAIVKDGDGYVTSDFVYTHQSSAREIYGVSQKRTLEYLRNQRTPIDQEYFDSFCMILGEKDFEKIKAVLEEAKRKTAEIVATSNQKTRICFYNTSLYFASQDEEGDNPLTD